MLSFPERHDHDWDHLAGSAVDRLSYLFGPGSHEERHVPGRGWLSLSLPLPGATEDFSSRYVFPDGGSALLNPSAVRALASGLRYSGDQVTFTGSLAGLSATSADGTVYRFSGQVSAAATAGSGSSGSVGGTGSAGTNTAPSRCQSYTNQCNAGGMAPCYCAAACVYGTAGDRVNEQKYRAEAARLGTTCSY
jgi:hypothetical protein